MVLRNKSFLFLAFGIAVVALILYWQQDAPSQGIPPKEKVESRPSPSPPRQQQKTENARPFLDELEMAVTDVERQGRYLLGKIVGSDGNAVPRCLITTVSEDGTPPYTAVARQDGSFYIMAPPGIVKSLKIVASGRETLQWDVPNP